MKDKPNDEIYDWLRYSYSFCILFLNKLNDIVTIYIPFRKDTIKTMKLI